MLTKGQSSVEYLFVVAIALLLLVPGSIIFYRYSADSQKSIVSSQVYKSGSDLITTADLMYSIGADSWQTIELTFPSDVNSLEVYRDGSMSELVISYGFDNSQAVFFTKTSLLNTTNNDCTAGCSVPIHDGLNQIRVESYDNGIIRYRVLE